MKNNPPDGGMGVKMKIRPFANEGEQDLAFLKLLEALKNLRRACPYNDSNIVTQALEDARLAINFAEGRE